MGDQKASQTVKLHAAAISTKSSRNYPVEVGAIGNLTGEVIDWISALQYGEVDTDRILTGLPDLGVLLKKNEDIDVLRQCWR